MTYEKFKIKTVQKLKKVILSELYSNRMTCASDSLNEVQILNVSKIRVLCNNNKEFLQSAFNELVGMRYITVKTENGCNIYTLTDIGFKHCESQSNSVINYLKRNHLAILALIVSIINSIFNLIDKMH